ncbi:hypothetical protein MSG28_001056 [Choristoneura fumiferana]|uniref:Uncharacterized protein n=1 Tax=Choristoneura fumiferana TaxID=7141 RepID=A0ACC0K3B5_CHOFU|nr:hypothetical protein MSG28_001056 [Choristoneura fumiferana]
MTVKEQNLEGILTAHFALGQLNVYFSSYYHAITIDVIVMNEKLIFLLKDIHRYFSAAREGDNIEVEAVTRKLGKKIAFLEVEIRNKDKNQVLATGRHTKYIGSNNSAYKVSVTHNAGFRLARIREDQYGTPVAGKLKIKYK